VLLVPCGKRRRNILWSDAGRQCDSRNETATPLPQPPHHFVAIGHWHRDVADDQIDAAAGGKLECLFR
jgi:hypothetical protein